MSDAWMPGAGQLRGAADGGPLQGGAPRAVWQAVGADPGEVSARSAAERLCELGRASHLTWNPRSGEIVQLVSILRAGRSLGGGECLASPDRAGAQDPGAGPGRGGASPLAGRGGASPLAGVNSEGRLCVQICVVGFAWDPFTGGPLTGLRHIMDWLDSWGMPRRWPAGPPAAFDCEYTGCRSRRLWAAGGHFGASQVPDCATAGPGEIEIERLTGRTAPRREGIRPPARGGQARALTRAG
ncbi:MAG: hypothetical protein ABSA03_01370 [Streptosporangiaceae bacterium]